MPVDTVPEAVRNKALTAGAFAWLEGLPALVEALEQEWSLTVGRSYADGTEAFVAEALLADGSEAALKLIVPRPGEAARREITALRLTGGVGCVELLRDDVTRSALLLERLGPSMVELSLPMARRHELLCDAATSVWRSAPDADLPTGAEKARRLADFIPLAWEDLGRPCSERAVADAVACAERRVAAHDDERAVLVHGDVHQWNALRAGAGFKLVDPDGWLAERELDLGVLMREDPLELLQGDPRERASWLAARTGLDADAIWEWGSVERVSNGLLCAQIDLQPVGREMLAAADHICGA